jgi:hypothetical protein
MLPTSFHDVTALLEVEASTWQRVLDLAGEHDRLKGQPFTHDGLWQSLASQSPADDSPLLDALEIIHELGTDGGRDLIQQAAEDQQVDLQGSEDEPSRELAARIWIESRQNTRFAELLRRARVNAHEAGHARVYREFVGKKVLTKVSLDGKRLLTAVRDWCQEHQRSEAVDVHACERDGEWRAEILRGEAIKRVVQIRDSRPAILDFRPAAADHIRYELETARLGLATRSPRLLQGYREIMGVLLAGDAEFFSGENICSLRPLQKYGRDLFERQRMPGILHVAVVELRWRHGDRDKILVRGRDCFKVLEDLGAHLNEGDLVEAKLEIVFSGAKRRGHVSLKVPNRIDIRAGANEGLVERLLDDVGVRGSFGDEGEPRDFWSLYPWRMAEGDWRRHLGNGFDRLVKQGTLRSVVLEATSHPDHPALAGAALVVEDLDTTAMVGISEDPAVGLRTLTISDVTGYELDLTQVAGEISKSLVLEGAPREIVSGVWSLGRRALSPTATLGIFLVARCPSESTAIAIREAGNGARIVLLIPSGCVCELDFSKVECPVPKGPYDRLLGKIVEQLGLQDEVLPPVWLTEDLILDQKRGTVWYRGIELTKVKADTHPFKFALAVMKATGRVVNREALNNLISPNRADRDVAKKAKLAFVDAVKASYADAGRECPTDSKDIFLASGGGYSVHVSARVL